MNDTARKASPEVGNGDGISHAYTPIGEEGRMVGSELQNDIHSMFSFMLAELHHDGIPKARWSELTLGEYQLLCPTLRLATQLLESAPSSEAICSVVYGLRRTLPPSITHGRHVTRFCKHNIPPFYVRETARKVLERLAESITFVLFDGGHRLKDDNAPNGHTAGIAGNFPQGVAVADLQEERGLASRVFVDRRFFRLMDELAAETLGKQFQILKANFEMAVTICHEVIHAINLAIASDLRNIYIAMGEHFTPRGFYEPYYQGQSVAELGYFWENEVFGGAFKQSILIRDNPFHLCEWPCWIFRDQQGKLQMAVQGRRARMWLLSAYYIKNIQTQEFWNTINTHHSQDLLALRISKRFHVVGFVPPNHMDYGNTSDPNAPENQLGPSFSVPFTGDDVSLGARIANETHVEREERVGREWQPLPPGRGGDFRSHIDQHMTVSNEAEPLSSEYSCDLLVRARH